MNMNIHEVCENVHVLVQLHVHENENDCEHEMNIYKVSECVHEIVHLHVHEIVHLHVHEIVHLHVQGHKHEFNPISHCPGHI
jgi:hypothetical protein